MRKLFLTVLLAISATALQAQTSIQVQTHNVVAVDEHFNVTFIIEGDAKVTDFTWSSGNDFQLLWGPQQGRSSSVQIINGKTTKSVQTTYSYLLRPQKTGKFTLPQATAKVNGNTITSKSVSIEVVASNSSAQQPSLPQQVQPKRQTAGVGDDELALKNAIGNSFQYHYLGQIPIFDELQNYDYVCLFSEKEGLPLSLIEGLMFGKPLITNDIPGALDVNVKNVTGFVCESYDMLINCLNSLPSRETPEYDNMSKNARKRYEALFTEEKMIIKYRELLSKL